MRLVLVILTALSMASPAFAEEYEKGPNGGLMLDVAGIDAELLTSGNTVTINVFEAFKAKPVLTNDQGLHGGGFDRQWRKSRAADPDAVGREQPEGRGEEAYSA